MKVELKSVKYAAFASQETPCFSAAIYVDGKRAGTVENDGHGGPDSIEPHDLEVRLTAHAKTLPVMHEGVENDAELLIGRLLNDHLMRRDMKRAIRKRILFTKTDEEGLFQTRAMKADSLARALADPDLKKKLGAEVVLNAVNEDEAFAAYKSAAA